MQYLENSVETRKNTEKWVSAGNKSNFSWKKIFSITNNHIHFTIKNWQPIKRNQIHKHLYLFCTYLLTKMYRIFRNFVNDFSLVIRIYEGWGRDVTFRVTMQGTSFEILKKMYLHRQQSWRYLNEGTVGRGRAE